MTINDDELETIVEQVLEDERERIYLDWINTEDIVILSLIIKRTWRKRKPIVVMDLEDWEQYRDNIKEVLQALFYAHKRLEFFKQTQIKAAKPFDDYIKEEVLTYDSAEFERMRKRFDEQLLKEFDEEAES